MIINAAALAGIFAGFSTSFTKGLGSAESLYKRIATVVPSSDAANTYSWMGQFPSLREWLGDRIVKNLEANAYTIVNKDFESTVSVPRNAIEDDKYGVFGPIFEEMGRAAGDHPDELIFSLLGAGRTTDCYDGQYFFDTDHPVIDPETGNEFSVSNFAAGAGPAWFLLDTSRPLKPMVFQERRKPQLVSKTDSKDDNVFWNKEYIYGVDGRWNVGFGLWQMSYASKEDLGSATYSAARKAMMSFRSDEGRPLGVKPNLLVVPPALEEAGLKVVNSETLANGESNPWKGTAELIVVPWMA